MPRSARRARVPGHARARGLPPLRPHRIVPGRRMDSEDTNPPPPSSSRLRPGSFPTRIRHERGPRRRPDPRRHRSPAARVRRRAPRRRKPAILPRARPLGASISAPARDSSPARRSRNRFSTRPDRSSRKGGGARPRGRARQRSLGGGARHRVALVGQNRGRRAIGLRRSRSTVRRASSDSRTATRSRRRPAPRPSIAPRA
jgi:hypothetical protein